MTVGVKAKFLTFDCYGTLVNFQMGRTLRAVLGERLPAARVDAFLDFASACRFDEVLGPWKSYRDVIGDATRHAMERFGIAYRESDGQAAYDTIGTWGPHPDVPEALRTLAAHYPLVILSNAADKQIALNVTTLGAPFHAVLTAEQARSYKPRFKAFEFMLDTLGCGPEEIVHVSSSVEYDLRPASELGITHRVLLNRSRTPKQPWIGYDELKDLSELPAYLGIGGAPAAKATLGPAT